MGGTDCHSQCAHWLRNDREFYKGCREYWAVYGASGGNHRDGYGFFWYL